MNKVPKIGDVITVTAKNDNKMSFVWRPETDTHMVTLVQSFPGPDDDAFCMSRDKRFLIRSPHGQVVMNLTTPFRS